MEVAHAKTVDECKIDTVSSARCSRRRRRINPADSDDNQPRRGDAARGTMKPSEVLEERFRAQKQEVDRVLSRATDVQSLLIMRCLIAPWASELKEALLHYQFEGFMRVPLMYLIDGAVAESQSVQRVSGGLKRMMLPLGRVDEAAQVYKEEQAWSNDQSVARMVLDAVIDTVFLPSSRAQQIVGIGDLASDLLYQMCSGWAPDDGPYHEWIANFSSSPRLLEEIARQRMCLSAAERQ